MSIFVIRDSLFAILSAIIFAFSTFFLPPAPEPGPAPDPPVQLAESEGLAFTLSEDGESYGLAGIGSCTDTVVVIPRLYEGKPVTEVLGNAFNRNPDITEVIFPDTLVTIGKDAFYGCPALEHISLPERLEVIGTRAFDQCTALTEVRLPSGLRTVGEWAFYRTGLREITIPKSLTDLQCNAFSGCSGMSVMKVEEGNPRFHSAGNCIIETAEKQLYSGCAASVIPSDGSVERIGLFAFYNSPIEKIFIPDTIRVLGDECFDSCYSLAEVRLSANLEEIGFAAFRHCIIERIDLPDSLKVIGRNAFDDCTHLSEVRLGSGLEQIQRYAFVNNIFTELVIPENVRNLEPEFIRGCDQLEKFTVKEGNETYHSAGNCIIETASKTLVAGCNSSVIPADGSVTAIGAYAFARSRTITELVIPEGVTRIGEEAFIYAESLKKVTLPASLKTVERAAFYYSGLETAVYAGTAAEWQQVSIAGYNDLLRNAAFTFKEE
ncbi:MAG: leucine-rich repeat protein [Lachnospiraceae bacterium]|nr:leucine-rich repeat protein [Lachnospiraceae bacterium]